MPSNARNLPYLPYALQQRDRFLSKLRPGPRGCLLWTGGVDKDGYGFFCVSLPRLEGKQQQVKVRTHRLAYELQHGSVPARLLVLHSCDTPACCNHEHLEAGNQLKNRRDAVNRGRVARGESHPRARLTEEQAREVIRLRKAGVSTKEIAGRFGRGVSTIQQVGTLYWRHLA